jgi:hypothetical protein
MICGPTLVNGREGLRQLLRERAGMIEHGLRLLQEDLDCGQGRAIDGVGRDAVGRAVLVLVGDAGDCGLPARVLQAQAFCLRNAEALERALPELGIAFVPFRILVIGQAFDRFVLDALEGLRVPELTVCELEPFRIGGQDKIAVRMLCGGTASGELDAGAEAGLRARWSELLSLLTRLDPAVRVVGDRFARRAALRGRNLCEFWCADGQLFGVVPGAAPRPLRGSVDLRAFGDAVLRRYLELNEHPMESGNGPARSGPVPAENRGSGPELRSRTLDALRQSLQATRLTHEEYSALGGPTAEATVPKGS